jgi:hypothetical protein
VGLGVFVNLGEQPARQSYVDLLGLAFVFHRVDVDNRPNAAGEFRTGLVLCDRLRRGDFIAVFAQTIPTRSNIPTPLMNQRYRASVSQGLTTWTLRP